MNTARLLTLAALLLIQLGALAADANKWEKEIRALEASDRTNPPPKSPIVFVGSSSIRLWKTLIDDFAPLPVINRGFGGSEISDSVQFADRIVIPYNPPLIVMYAGGNDIHAGKTPEVVFRDFKAFVAKITNALPKTKIAYISIAPNPARWKEVEQVKAANHLISRFADEDPKVEFIDVFHAMLGEDGMPRPNIYVADQLHMNERGYALWKGIVRPLVAKWIKAPTR